MAETPGGNFDRLLAFCRRVNPAALVGGYPERERSATVDGLYHAGGFGGRVLILGCGDGYEVAFAREELGWDAVGLTFHPVEAAEKNRKCRAEDMVVGDLHALPWPDGTFDCVYSKETLEHSPCPFLALVESSRVLKMGGRFFHLIADGWDKQRDWYHLSCLPDWLWCDLMRKAGLHVEEVKTWPDCERCEFVNKAYSGRKVHERRLEDGASSYMADIGFAGRAFSGWEGG